MTTATQPVQAEAQTETPAETVSETVEPQVQEQPQAKEFDPATVDPKAKEYFERTYSEKFKDYDTLKQEAEWAKSVKGDRRFQEWTQTLNAPKPPEPFQISEEEHTAALGNPAKFAELVAKAARQIAEQQFAPKIAQVEQQARFEAANRELTSVKSKHPEFEEIDKAGHILPVLQRYPGISFEDALAIAKQTSGWVKKEINDKATGQVKLQKAAMTERPGGPSTSQGKKKFKDRVSAMEYVMDQAKLGKDVDEDDLEID